MESTVVSAEPFCQILHVGGAVLPAPGDESFAIAPVSGTVSFAGKTLSEGVSVSSGTVIAGISTKGIAGGDVTAKLRATYEAAKNEYERDAAMVKENIVSNSHFEQSKLAYEQAKAEYEAVAAASGDKVSVKSPLTGYVKSLYVTSGQYVEAGTAIAAISQNRTLQLKADVPDRYASSLRNISDANFTTASGEVLSVKELGGRVSSYGRVSESGYIPVVFEFPNRSDVVAGSFSDVYLKGSATSAVISLPASAIIEEQGVYSVFVRLDEDCFMKREVKLGETDGVKTVILSGIEEGEEVVTSGAMHIKLSSFSAVPSGHNHNH